MKSAFMFSFLFICLNCFGQDAKPGFTLESIWEDSLLNIRALEIEGQLVYIATANSEQWVFNKNDDKFKQLFEVDTINKPNFRALSVVNGNVFALGIGSPALLYKNGKIVYKESHEKAFYDSMEFWDSDEGIAMGDPTEGCISIIITRDGGETWKKISCASLPKALAGEAAFAASDTNISIIGDHTWIATGGFASRIFYSPDRGKSWQVFETPIVQGKNTTGMYSVDFHDEKQGYAIGGDYTNPKHMTDNKISTSDGGKTWKVEANEQNPSYRSCVKYFPKSDGKKLLAVGFEGIDYSENGGKTWTHITDEGFYTVRFLSEKVAFVAGKGRVSKITFE